MTYKQAQRLYEDMYGKTIKSCWIADVLRSHGKTKRKAWNRIGIKPKYPCPDSIKPRLDGILQDLNMIPSTCPECGHLKLLHRRSNPKRTCLESTCQCARHFRVNKSLLFKS